MKLSEKAQAALNKVIDQFKSGDLSPITRIARIQRQGEPSPFDKWSFSNKVLAFIQTGDLDCRGFDQWKKVGRHVKKGSNAAFILAPLVRRSVDEETGKDKSYVYGFRTVSVFGISQTDGEPLAEHDYAPAELPPLMDVAERLGVDVRYMPLPADRLGDCQVDGSKIRLGTHDTKVWFHELAHAAHARLSGGLKGGQDPKQEAVAEFTAAVLMEMYGLGDRTGNCWNYIKMYADDPLTAITRALKDIEGVLAIIEEAGDEA